MSILEEALKVSGENRQRDYGHPLENHERIAAVWNVVLGKKLKPGESITPEEVVWCMIGVKLAREVNSPKRDNALDVAGYVNCLDLIDQKRGQQRVEGECNHLCKEYRTVVDLRGIEHQVVQCSMCGTLT